MSSTRHAPEGAPLRQERYCSSPEFDRGLMANHVAQRCTVLSDPLDRELIWFLQYISHERGLKRFSEELLALHPDEIGTAAMLEIGERAKYTGEQVCAIRRELPAQHDPMRWDDKRASLQQDADISNRLRAMHEGREVVARPALQDEGKPSSYPAGKFLEVCRAAAKTLPDYLAELCLNPALRVDAGPWYFPKLISILRAFMDEWALQCSARVVSTDVSRRVSETLDYSRKMRCLVLVEGIEGTGKTWAAEHSCRQRPGLARYVQVPATDQEMGFYVEIARAIGLSIPSKAKAGDLSRRIEDTLQTCDLQIVFDEAHWLFGVNGTRGGLPKRMLWVMTALVNKGVPVAFVATPQWEANKKFIKQHTRWRDGQLTGRIGHHEQLPAVLSEEELAAVVRAHLPAADDCAVTAITDYARNKERCLGVLSAVVKRARFIAEKNQRPQPSRADIAAAIAESGMRITPKGSAAAAPAPERSISPAAPLPTARNVTAQGPRKSRVATPTEEAVC